MWDLIVSVPDHCLSFYFTLMGKIVVIKKNRTSQTYIFTDISEKPNKGND